MKLAAGDDDTTRALLHAAVGCLGAAGQGADCGSGALGASGAVALNALFDHLGGVNGADLTAEQKEARSNLVASLLAGAAAASGGDAGAAGTAGRLETENNGIAGMAGSSFGFWASEIPDCDINCKANLSGELAEANLKVSSYEASIVGLGVLSLESLALAGLTGSTNASMQYYMNGEVGLSDVLISAWVGALTGNSGFLGVVGFNAAGGAISNSIKGDDPLEGASISAVGSSFGYGIGKLFSSPLNKYLNPNSKNWEWVQEGIIYKPMPLSPIPSYTGNAGSSISTEGAIHGYQQLEKIRNEW